MKKVLVILCAVLMTAGYASGHNMKKLLKQVRSGETDAYKSLAICYRDGNGVRKSWLNMICAYEMYALKTNGELEGVLDILEEGHPFRLLTQCLVSESDENVELLLTELRRSCPVEAKAVETAMELYTIEEESVVMERMASLADEGSELAAVCQWVIYDEASDKSGMESCYVRLAEKYPSFNLLLGDMYLERYGESDDFADILKAVEYYHKADAHGHLSPGYANILLGMYDYYGKEGLLDCSESELKRLEQIRNRY